jgi:hypothetical protein
MGQQTRIDVEKEIYVKNVHRLVIDKHKLCQKINGKRFFAAQLEFVKFLWNVLSDLGFPSTGFTSSVRWAVKVKSVSTLYIPSLIRYYHFLTSGNTPNNLLFCFIIQMLKVTRDRREMLKEEGKNSNNVPSEMLESENIVQESSRWNCKSNVNYQLINTIDNLE